MRATSNQPTDGTGSGRHSNDERDLHPQRIGRDHPNLPSTQKKKLVPVIDSLAEDVLDNSYILFGDNTPRGGIRATHAGNLRVLFRYTPENHSIIVTDVSSMTQTAAEATA